MNPKRHFLLLAHYNQRLNRQVFEASAKLDSDALALNRGAFFGSILGTLNHLLVGDLLWLGRFRQLSPQAPSLQLLDQMPTPSKLDQQLYSELAALWTVRRQLDQALINWIDTELAESDFKRLLSYKNSQGISSCRRFDALLTHLFNHQTHHRGQISTLLQQQGVDIGVTDLLIDIPEI